MKEKIKETVNRKLGDAVISMHIKDDTDFLSVFSENETPVISGEVAEFIETRAKKFFPNKELTLKISSECIDDVEKILYKEAIKEYYTEKHREAKRELRVYNRIALILSLLGVAVLALSIFWEYRTGSRLWSEVIDIVAWVLLWEAVDIKFFKTRELAVCGKRYLALRSMEILYVTPKNGEAKKDNDSPACAAV